MRYEPEQCPQCELWFPPDTIPGDTCRCLACATDGIESEPIRGCEEEWEVCRNDPNYDPTPDFPASYDYSYDCTLTKDQIRRGEGL